mmetsp:Transcript_10680/g.24939  ORF Transcript_10680/g.24939 Transcript_10680/m.24939 type:complete len:791 (+) Transcript_10680:508-2880(+)
MMLGKTATPDYNFQVAARAAILDKFAAPRPNPAVQEEEAALKPRRVPGLLGGEGPHRPDGCRTWIMVVGGRNSKRQVLASAELLAPGASSWRVVADMKTPRAQCCSVGVGRARVYAMGGVDRFGLRINSVEYFDVPTAAWHPAPPLRHARSGAVACCLPSPSFARRRRQAKRPGATGQLAGLAAEAARRGGGSSVGPSSGAASSEASSEADLVDPAARTLIVVAGGRGQKEEGALRSVEALEAGDASCGAWRPLPPMHRARDRPFAAVAFNRGHEQYEPWRVGHLMDECVLVVCGGVGSDGKLEGSLEVFRPSEGSWRLSAQPMPEARYGGAACAVGGLVYIFGGMNSTGLADAHDALVYDVRNDRWLRNPRGRPLDQLDGAVGYQGSDRSAGSPADKHLAAAGHSGGAASSAAEARAGPPALWERRPPGLPPHVPLPDPTALESKEVADTAALARGAKARHFRAVNAAATSQGKQTLVAAHRWPESEPYDLSMNAAAAARRRQKRPGAGVPLWSPIDHIPRSKRREDDRYFGVRDGNCAVAFEGNRIVLLGGADPDGTCFGTLDVVAPLPEPDAALSPGAGPAGREGALLASAKQSPSEEKGVGGLRRPAAGADLRADAATHLPLSHGLRPADGEAAAARSVAAAAHALGPAAADEYRLLLAANNVEDDDEDDDGLLPGEQPRPPGASQKRDASAAVSRPAAAGAAAGGVDGVGLQEEKEDAFGIEGAPEQPDLGPFLPLCLNALPQMRVRRAWHGAAVLERYQPEVASLSHAAGGENWAKSLAPSNPF